MSKPNNTKPIEMLSPQRPASHPMYPEEDAILNDIKTVTEPAIGSRPDFSGVSSAIRRAREDAATRQTHKLAGTAMSVGISLAGDFLQPTQNEEDETNVFIGW